MFCIYLTISIITILSYCYYCLCNNRNFWKERGVPFEQPHFLYGNNHSQLINPNRSLGWAVLDLYRKFDDCKYIGFWRFFTKGVFVRDPQLIQTILTTEFAKFQENDFKVDKNVDILSGYNPFFQSGEDWKKSRNHFILTITLAKMRTYFSDMIKCSDHMVEYVSRNMNKDGFYDCKGKQLLGMYTTDVVANVIYGVDNNSFENKDNFFSRITTDFLENALSGNIKILIALYFPKLSKFLRLRMVSKGVQDILLDFTQRIIKSKSAENSSRKDFFQTMLELRKSNPEYDFSDEYIASHAFGFVMDGFETSGSFIVFTLLELAWNQDVQNKLRDEIAEMLNETGGHYDHDRIMNMKYLDMVSNESLRLHPPAFQLQKLCTSDDYELPAYESNKSVKIGRGTLITIPVMGIHRDAQFYEDPDQFIPERFEHGAEKYKHVFLSFGYGPRICPGRRYGMTQSKLALVALLRHFQVEPQPGSEYPLDYEAQAFLLRPLKDGLLRFRRIQQ